MVLVPRFRYNGILSGRNNLTNLLSQKFQQSAFLSSSKYDTSISSRASGVDAKVSIQKNEPPVPEHFLGKGEFTRAPKSAIAQQSIHDWETETMSNLPHPVWSKESTEGVQLTHLRPQKIVDMLALLGVKIMRVGFDVLSGYSFGHVTERIWITRIVFLETVAGVPGMVGAGIRHFRSLRRMERDYGWIHTLLSEAENERMHLMCALQLKQPGYLFRIFVATVQMGFVPFFTIAYALSSRFAHRFVGYLEEEACKTYTHLLEELAVPGRLPGFDKAQVPLIAKQYWQMPDNSSFRDMILAIRADESHHRDVNHTFASLNVDEPNPFPPGH